MAAEIISRKDARAQGLKRYFNGSPCPSGHVSERFVSTYGCVECVRINAAEWYAVGQFLPVKEVATSARTIAREKGVARYFTGEPCKRGHVCERYVSKAVCVECNLNRHKNEEGARKKRDRDRRYSALNAEKARKRSKDWKQANPDRARDNELAWRNANPAKVREGRFMQNHRRRARENAASGMFDRADLDQIIKSQYNRCAYCRIDLRRVKKHLDHIEPLFRGGSCDRNNLQYLCAPCNLSKGARDPIEFAKSRGLLL